MYYAPMGNKIISLQRGFDIDVKGRDAVAYRGAATLT